MAVLEDADPLDIALSEIGELIGDDRADTLAGMSAIAGLWHRVYDGAMDRYDVPLAVLAAREWCNAMRVIRAIASRSTSPPS